MNASQCSFEQMVKYARTNPSLAKATSFMQVEFGKAELLACWDGFVDSSDGFGLTFKSRKQIYENFSDALTSYLDFLQEPLPEPLG